MEKGINGEEIVEDEENQANNTNDNLTTIVI